MSRTSYTRTPESEEELVALLATLKVERVEEADFEGRFLVEFHERVAREAVCCPARRHLLAHLMQMLDNIGRGRLAFGASAMGLAGLMVCFALYPAEQAGLETAATVSREKNITPLHLPALSSDLAEYTSVRVHQEPSVFENHGVMITRGQHATIIQISNTYAPVQQKPYSVELEYRMPEVPVFPAGKGSEAY